MKEVKLRTKRLDFEVSKEDGEVWCTKIIELDIYGNKKHFEGFGQSICAEGNIFDVPFGKALAEVRATQDIYRQMEISLIKYSFDHLLEPTEEEDFFRTGVLEAIDYPNVTINIGGGSK